MNREEIEQILPHRDSMLIPDRITTISAPEFATGVKTVTSDEPCFDVVGYAADEQFPASLMIEFLGQVAAVLCVVSFAELGPRSSLHPIFASACGVKLRRQPEVGETLVGTARISRRLDDVVQVAGQVRVGDEIIMDADRALIAFRRTAPATSSTGMTGLRSEALLEGMAR